MFIPIYKNNGFLSGFNELVKKPPKPKPDPPPKQAKTYYKNICFYHGKKKTARNPEKRLFLACFYHALIFYQSIEGKPPKVATFVDDSRPFLSQMATTIQRAKKGLFRPLIFYDLIYYQATIKSGLKKAFKPPKKSNVILLLLYSDLSGLKKCMLDPPKPPPKPEKEPDQNINILFSFSWCAALLTCQKCQNGHRFLVACQVPLPTFLVVFFAHCKKCKKCRRWSGPVSNGQKLLYGSTKMARKAVILKNVEFPNRKTAFFWRLLNFWKYFFL